MSVPSKHCVFFYFILFLIANQISAIENSRNFNKVERHQVQNGETVAELKPAKIYEVGSLRTRTLSTFCWQPEPQRIVNLWKTVLVQININGTDFTLYHGDNSSHVAELHRVSQQSWFSVLPWKTKEFHVSPFQHSCFGVFTSEAYAVNLNIRRIDFKRVLMAVSGTVIFLSSPNLCQNVAFHYASGVCLGLTASLLIVVYLVSRLVPKKSGSYAILLGGWSVALYVLQKVWDNTYSILHKYQPYVVGYFLVCGLVSFAVSYRFGPIKNPKTVHLLQWALQAVGLILIFVSSDYHEASMSVILVLLAAYNFPATLSARISTFWRRRFPPKIRLLTEEEFIQQGSVETKKALDDLRRYCRSPDCNAWKTMSRLKEPLRFADFVEGASHLSNDELLDYEAESVSPNDDLTDDESF